MQPMWIAFDGASAPRSGLVMAAPAMRPEVARNWRRGTGDGFIARKLYPKKRRAIVGNVHPFGLKLAKK
jgi:hypothetical protein